MFEFDKYIRDFFKWETDKELKKAWKKVFEGMALHTRKLSPKELLKTSRPNESPEVTAYREANFRFITFGAINKSIDDIYRTVSGVNYSIENESEETKKFIDGNNFEGYNLETFLQKKVIRRDIEDPNGFLVWLPSGEGIFESNKKVSPKPLLVYSEKLHYTDYENVFSFLSDEVNKIKVGGTEIDGKVYYIFTKTDFYKYVQIGAEKDEVYTLFPIYKHDIGQIPVIVLGGNINDDNHFDSFFSSFLEFGNEALLQFSDWQSIMKTCGFPIKEEFVQDCEIQIFNKRNNPIDETEEKFDNENKTRSEKVIANTVFGTIKRKIPSKNASFDDTLDASMPSVRFIAPPIEVAVEAKESWKTLFEKAQDALQQSLSFAGDSGKKVELTNEGKYSMLAKIMNNYFDNIYLKSLIFIECYLTLKKSDNVNISINKPSTFSIRTEQDIVNEMEALADDNIAQMFRAELNKELANKRFSGNPLAQKMFNLIIIIDPLFTYSIAEKTQMQLANNISILALVTSVNAYGVLNKIAMDMTADGFIKATEQSIIDKFNVEIKSYIPQQTTLVDPLGNP